MQTTIGHEHREQHSSSGRTIRSDASYAIAGWPCANLAYHSNSSREKGGGDERKRAANAFLRASYHRVTKRVCHTIRSREPRYLLPAIISLSSFQNFLFDVSLFLDWKNRRSNVDRRGLDFSDLFESKIESLRLGQDSREESLKLKNKIFLRILENFVSRNKKLSHSSIGWKFESMYLRKIVLEFLNFCRERASRERDPSWSDSNRFYPIRLDRSRIDPI